MMKNQKKKTIVSCPQCGKDVEWSPNNPYRPFCSERCKLIDLGQWANEGYRIPDKDTVPDQDGSGSGHA